MAVRNLSVLAFNFINLDGRGLAGAAVEFFGPFEQGRTFYGPRGFPGHEFLGKTLINLLIVRQKVSFVSFHHLWR